MREAAIFFANKDVQGCLGEPVAWDSIKPVFITSTRKDVVATVSIDVGDGSTATANAL